MQIFSDLIFPEEAMLMW